MKLKKETIRNSISDVGSQLLAISYFFRMHRALIAGAKKVRSRKGNTLGYCLKLLGIDNEISVSSQNTKDFNKRLSRFMRICNSLSFDPALNTTDKPKHSAFI